jgi:hypothetical protein
MLTRRRKDAKRTCPAAKPHFPVHTKTRGCRGTRQRSAAPSCLRVSRSEPVRGKRSSSRLRVTINRPDATPRVAARRAGQNRFPTLFQSAMVRRMRVPAPTNARLSGTIAMPCASSLAKVPFSRAHEHFIFPRVATCRPGPPKSLSASPKSRATGPVGFVACVTLGEVARRWMPSPDLWPNAPRLGTTAR